MMVGGILTLHVAGLWGLMQLSPVRETVLQVAPMFVDWIAPPAPPTPPKRLQPPPSSQALPKQAPPPLPLVAAAPSPAPAAFVVPAPPPEAPPVATAPAVPTMVATAPPASPPPPPKLIPASAVQYLEPPTVEYPRQSRRNAESGVVILRAYIDTSGGAPRNVQIDQSSGFVRLDQAALAAVQKARFKPSTANGQAIEGWARIPINFELEK